MEDFNSKYTGQQVEALLDQVASGNAGGGGGGGITIETDPVFSASPAATITEEKITVWNDAADLVGPLDQDIAQLYSDLANKQDAITDLETIREGAAKGATAVQSKDVAGIVTEEGFVAAEDLAKVATSGSYNDLVDKPTIPSAVTESTVSGWGFTKNTGTYSKPSGGIPASDLASDVNDALRKAEQYTGTVTGIKLNGETLGANAGVVDLGVLLQGEISGNTTAVNIQGFINDNLYVLPNAANGDEDDILLSRDSVKTINGQSIFGSGDIEISGGGSSSGGGKEVVVTSYLGAISPHTIYVLNWTIDSLYIDSFVTSSAPYETYDIIFKSAEMILGGDFSITLPSNIWWANGIVPTVEVDTLYELSIVKTTIENIDYFSAVLTPFKSV